MTCALPAQDEFSFAIAVDGSAPAAARRSVHDCLAGRVGAGTLEQLELLVSELVTNVVRHADTQAGDALALEVRLREDEVRIDVFDGDGQPFDSTPSPDPARGRGYGLFLVERLSRRWGVEHTGGTRVWFELALAG